MSFKHGKTRTAEYRVWDRIKRRCGSPKHSGFKNYGGRGIFVCEEWVNDFARFLADMGLRPSPDHSIERRDNDGPYAPWNCVWATSAEQDSNKRTNTWLEFRGRKQTQVQWERELGFSKNLIHARMRRGWTLERALTEPQWR